MPIIPPQLLSCAFYLYKDRKSAEAGERAGGTGFLIALPSGNGDGLGHHYGVTNYHVAVSGGYSCIRINTADGKTEVFEFGPDDWHFVPGGPDVAVIPLDIRGPGHIALFIGDNLIFQRSGIESARVGPGDNVFMVGRFIDLDDARANIPTVRLGHISSGAVPIKQPNGHTGECFTIDMHSRSGFSGSPVFVYRTPGNTIEWAIHPNPQNHMRDSLLGLLGVHCGQFPEKLPIKKAGRGKKIAYGDLLKDEYVEGMSGMTIVIPGWCIFEILERPELIRQREKAEAMRVKTKDVKPPEALAEACEGDPAKRSEDTVKSMLSPPPQPKTAKRTRAKR